MTALVPELACSDCAASVDFYVKILGFRVMFDRPEEGFAYLEREGAELMLDELGKTRDWLKASAEYPFGRGLNLQIKTADVEKLYDDVRRAGADIFLEMETKWYRCGDEMLGNRQFIVCDPDGYLLRFFEDLGKKNAV